jgi:DNA-binding beta-propeller fold protein YncE
MTAAVSALALVAGAVGTVATATPAAAEGWEPRFERSIGGTGLAGVYAWGLQYNPVTDEILVSDYFNYVIRRYNRDGEQVGTFGRAASERNGQPYSLAVDDTTGDLYVGEYGDNQPAGFVAKYDKNGKWLYSADTGARYTAWIATDGEGYVYVADSHFWNDEDDPAKIRKYRFDDATETAIEVASFGVYGNGEGQINTVRGFDVAENGNIYVADGGQNVVNEFTNDGTFVRRMTAPFRGDIRGLSLDEERDRFWVVDAQGGQLERFRLSDGKHLGTSGSVGSGEGQFADGGRQVDVTPDGHAWVADYGNFKVHEYDQNGVFVDEYPRSVTDPAVGFTSKLRDVSVAPDGNVWVADTWNHRFQKFSPDGEPLGVWGRRNSDAPYGMNYPRGIGVDPETENVWVANTRQHMLRVYDKDANFLFNVGDEEDSTDPGSFRWTLDVDFGPGLAVITDYIGGRVKGVSTADGTELWSYPVYVATGTAVDAATDRLYVASPLYNRILVYQLSSMGTTNTLLGTYGTAGTEAGQFDQIMDLDIIGDVIYASDVNRHKVIAYSTTDGSYVGEFGGVGNGAGQFREPSGLSHDAQGRLYVADSSNYRVQVFSFGGGQTNDAAAPTVTFESPVANATVEPGNVTIGGLVSDPDGVGAVEVLVRDQTTNLAWDVTTSSWKSGGRWAVAALRGADRNALAWSWNFNAGTSGHTYQVRVRAHDAAGNMTVAPFPTRTFKIGTAAPPDAAKPVAVISAPTAGQVLTARPVTVSGTATDDVALAGVEVGVRDNATMKWWNPETNTWGTHRLNDAMLDTPGGKSSTWSWSFDDSANKGAGAYYVSVRARDASGKVQTAVGRQFKIQSAPPPTDTAKPTVVLTEPTANQLYPTRPATFTGTAADDRGVKQVQVAVKQNGTSLFWNPATSTWGPIVWFDATLASPGASSTGWSLEWSDAARRGSGTYFVQVRSKDTANKLSAQLGRKFRIAN